MEKKKLLIAESSEDFCWTLQACLQDRYQITVCREGCETLRQLISAAPDLMVLDMMLPGMDGISLLLEAQKHGPMPAVLAVSRFYSDYMIAAMERLGVGYVMLKPCSAAAVAARLEELLTQAKSADHGQTYWQNSVDSLLRQLRIPSHQRGYGCLREAILEILRDPDQQITKTLYPAVGRVCGGNGEQVEHAIRTVIRKAWNCRNEAQWNAFFSHAPAGQLKCPSNKLFIYTAAQHILADDRKKNTYLLKIG